MSNPSWPVGLPQYVLQDGYEETEPDTVVRSPMETGPAKLRRRFTQGQRQIRCALSLTNSEVDTLSTFYETTLSGGALAFDWKLPRTQVNATFRFLERPRYAPEGGDNYVAIFSLEVMP